MADFWGAVISGKLDTSISLISAYSYDSTDYTKFASENGERLAEAISSGIPATLRGMMWQLMCVAAIMFSLRA